MANLRAKDFDFGVPKILAFKAAGASVPSKINGDQQVRFATIAGDFLYLDETPAGDIEREMQELGIRYGEEFRMTRAKTSHGGSRFSVERVRDAGGHNVPERSRAAGGFVENPPARSSEYNNINNTNNGTRHTEAPALPSLPGNAVTPASAKLMACFVMAIDAVAEAQLYANRKGLGITFSSEDVRSTAISCWISDCKNGGRA